MNHRLTRRSLLGMPVAAAAAAAVPGTRVPAASPAVGESGKPALLGGAPVRTSPFPSWPVAERNEERSLNQVLSSGRWNRGPAVQRFEEAWARQLGCPWAIATASGTAALCTSLHALDIGPGDEVIVPPYTFVATINVVLLNHALPIFVDSDRRTFQIDAAKVEAAVTERTRCLLPVHLGGSSADLDRLLEVAHKRGLPLLEDACQAHFGEWKGRRVGTWGDLGCFSFQASKNLNSGEGGAVVGHNPELIAACAGFQDAGRGYQAGPDGRLQVRDDAGFTYARVGDNRRLTEFQGALLLEQLTRLEEQCRVREQNAAYLTGLLREIPGIQPAEMYPGCTRNAYHLYMFRYRAEAFAGMPRSRFLAALEAEGIPNSAGYGRLNQEPFLMNTLRSRGFLRIYGEKDIARWAERNHCPENDRLCEEAVWLFQTMLLGPRSDMDQIAEAVRKIQRHAAELVG